MRVARRGSRLQAMLKYQSPVHTLKLNSGADRRAGWGLAAAGHRPARRRQRVTAFAWRCLAQVVGDALEVPGAPVLHLSAAQILRREVAFQVMVSLN